MSFARIGSTSVQKGRWCALMRTCVSVIPTDRTNRHERGFAAPDVAHHMWDHWHYGQWAEALPRSDNIESARHFTTLAREDQRN